MLAGESGPKTLLRVSGSKHKTCGLSRAPTRGGGGGASGPSGRGVAFVPEGGWGPVGLCLCASLCSSPAAAPKTGGPPRPRSRGRPLPAQPTHGVRGATPHR